MTAGGEVDHASSSDLPRTAVSPDGGEIKVSIIAPVYCCQDWLEELFTRIRSAVGAVTEDFEVILVEDGSPDGSWAELCRLADQDRRLKALRLSRNFGQHAAVSAGLECARGKITVLMDSDLQDEPESIPALFKKLNQGFDIVYTIAEGRARSGLTSRLFHRQFAKVTDSDLPSGIGSFRAFTAKVREAILLHHERNFVYGPLMHSFGFAASVVEVKRAPRRAGKSAYSLWRRVQLSIAIMIVYSNTFNAVFACLGEAIVALSLLYGCLIVFQYVIVGRILGPGITFIQLLLIFLVGMVALGFGAIGTYLHFIYREVLRRPRYLIRDTRNTPLRVNLQDWRPPAWYTADELHHR
jgi:dolichol-phosphate mannosyltransferase